MTRAHLGFGEREQKVIPGFADKRHGAAVGQQVFVNSDGLTRIRLMVQRVKNLFNVSSCPGFSRFLVPHQKRSVARGWQNITVSSGRGRLVAIVVETSAIIEAAIWVRDALWVIAGVLSSQVPLTYSDNVLQRFSCQLRVAQPGTCRIVAHSAC